MLVEVGGEGGVKEGWGWGHLKLWYFCFDAIVEVVQRLMVRVFKGQQFWTLVDNSCDYRMWRLLLSLCPLAHFTNSGQYKIHAVRTHVNICCNTYWACEVLRESVWVSRTWAGGIYIPDIVIEYGFN